MFSFLFKKTKITPDNKARKSSIASLPNVKDTIISQNI